MEKNSESPGPPVYAGHCPVLYEAILGYVDYPADAVVVDATLGLAGHSLGLAERLGPGRFAGRAGCRFGESGFGARAFV